MLSLVFASVSRVDVEVLKAGDGVSFPQAGQNVKVHYTGTLMDGTKFDSSRDRGEPFSFNLGAGQVISCWDQGVAQVRFTPTSLPYQLGSRGAVSHLLKSGSIAAACPQMSMGERAKLTCSSDSAYGSRGAGGVIPPNADLQFDGTRSSHVQPSCAPDPPCSPPAAPDVPCAVELLGASMY
tara:strand:+ start:2267 stop:2809 length:543 start_codon:yes stop_codon:yes gene_type:complete